MLPAHAVAAGPCSPDEGPRTVSSVLQLVGNTPLIELRHLRDGVAPGVRLLAKLEGCNPGGSVKDRPALRMIQDGLARGALVPGKTILDSTSGNTGIALAMIGAALGYPVKLVMPSNVSTERKRVIAAFGAEIVFSDPLEGSDGPSASAAPSWRRSRGATSSPTSTTTPPIPSPTTRPPGRRSSGRRAAPSPTWWPASAPAAPSWGPAAT